MSTDAISIVKVIDGQIVQGEELHIFLSELSKQAKGIVVSDQTTYSDALEICKRAGDACKQVMLAAEPERLELRRRLDELLSQRDKVIVAIQSQVAQLEQTARTWNLNEKAAAKREQDRINEEARKAAEKANFGKRAANRVEPVVVNVAPNIPTVPGKRIIERYRFELLDLSKVKREFLCLNETKVNMKLRTDKDAAKSEREIGGIRVRIE